MKREMDKEREKKRDGRRLIHRDEKRDGQREMDKERDGRRLIH